MQQTEQPTEPKPAKVSLFDIVAGYHAVLARIDEAEGEISDADAAELDALAPLLGDKAEAVKAICLTLDAEAAACDRMAQPYIERAARKRAHRDRLKRRLFDAMIAAEARKVEGATGGARIQKNGAAALELLVPEHELEAKVPAEFFETVRVLKRDAIKDRLEKGDALTFAKLTRGEHLRWI